MHCSKDWLAESGVYLSTNGDNDDPMLSYYTELIGALFTALTDSIGRKMDVTAAAVYCKSAAGGLRATEGCVCSTSLLTSVGERNANGAPPSHAQRVRTEFKELLFEHYSIIASSDFTNIFR
jgi:hypothetical protein